MTQYTLIAFPRPTQPPISPTHSRRDAIALLPQHRVLVVPAPWLGLRSLAHVLHREAILTLSVVVFHVTVRLEGRADGIRAGGATFGECAE